MSLLSIDKSAPGYWRVGIDNPPLNLMTPELFASLRLFLENAQEAPGLKVVLFESKVADFFVAHLDTNRAAEVPDVPGAANILEEWADFIARFAAARFATIASVRGRARGIGNEFLLAFDMRFASREHAVFAQPEVGASVVPGGGGLDWLPRLTGRSRALEIMLGAQDYDAVTAEAYGWINRAIPDAELDGFVDQLARRISLWDTAALRKVKEIVGKRSAPAHREEVAESLAAIGALWARPEAKARIAAMDARGNNTPGDFELNQPHFMAVIAQEERDKEAEHGGPARGGSL